MHDKDLIHYLCAEIDVSIAEKMDRLLHQPAFKDLESVWRAVNTLVKENNRKKPVLIKILSLNLTELKQDVSANNESHVFELIHAREFDQAGGQPYALLISNFRLSRIELEAWEALAQIAIQAFCVILMPGIQEDLKEHATKWRDFRKKPSSGFLGLCLGRILVRTPYSLRSHKKSVYEESSSALLYKESVWIYAELIIQSFIKHGWFYDLNSPLNPSIQRLRKRNYPQTLCEKIYYPQEEQALEEEGFICLSDQPLFNQLYFRSHQSLYENPPHSGIQDLGSALALSRFAHHLKVLLRNKLSRLGKEGCESYLQQWAQSYCSKHNPMTPDSEFKYPLDEARIKIMENQDKNLSCLIELKLKNLFIRIEPAIFLSSELSL